ncbi:hypothetical protein C8Q72DRAFT_831948 [Fomitopsis betulina]|nr:hypothetical protein C8Q72DRAFT_831948 [Fomitopsis betulina]
MTWLICWPPKALYVFSTFMLLRMHRQSATVLSSTRTAPAAGSRTSRSSALRTPTTPSIAVVCSARERRPPRPP